MAYSCHVLQSLIFIMLDDIGKTHTDGIPMQFMIVFDFDISLVNWSSHSVYTDMHKK